MDDCTAVFETLKGFLPMNILEKAINETGTDQETKKFTALRQLNTLMYANLKQKAGLRDITTDIEADENLQKHTGTISYSQLSRKNSDRDPLIFQMIFNAVLAKLKKHHGIRVIPGSWGTLKALDATTMDLCLSLFPWAKFRKTKAAIKMHTLLDISGGYPEEIQITEGSIHEKNTMSTFLTVPDITYLIDRGYVDYREYDRCCKDGIFFITRLKKNAVMEVINKNALSTESPVLSDKEVILGGINNRMQHFLRAVEVIDSSSGEQFFILTNRFDLTAEEIAEIYRLRWQIEIFFKWIKQHLKIKKFYGTSYNAVSNQLYAALILFFLLKLMHILVGTKCEFLKLVRLIANGLWNSLSKLKAILHKQRPPGNKQKRFNWKREYASLLVQCLVSKRY
jgi:hypothetical protein